MTSFAVTLFTVMNGAVSVQRAIN